MKRRIFVGLLTLFAVVFPALRVGADDVNTSLLRTTNAAAQAGTVDNRSRRNVGLTLLGLGSGVFVFGATHPVALQCPYGRCVATTRDPRVFISGAVVASVGAWLLWQAHTATKPKPLARNKY
jgi:hypothetical protein